MMIKACPAGISTDSLVRMVTPFWSLRRCTYTYEEIVDRETRILKLAKNVILRCKPKPVLSIAKELMRSFTSFRMTFHVGFFTEFTLSQKARPFASPCIPCGAGLR